MSNRPSQVTAACYAQSADGRWHFSYPLGNAPIQTQQLTGAASSVSSSVANIQVGAGFTGAATTISTARASLHTIGAPVPLVGAATAGVYSSGSLATGFTISTATPLPQATTGSAYSQTFASVNGVGTVTWVGSGLPTGLTLSGATLSGTLSTPGTFTFTISATDSSGGGTAPTITNYIDSGGFPSPGSQPSSNGNPAFLVTTSPVLLSPGDSVLGFITAANYGGAHSQGTVTDTEGNSYANKVALIGTPNAQGGSINQTQETDLMWCPSVIGDTTTANKWTQSYGSSGDRDYQESYFLRMQNVGTLVGATGQKMGDVGGTTGIAPGTNNVTPGTAITVTQAQCPCYLIAMAFNISELGTNTYTPTVGTNMPGAAVTTNNIWSFGEAHPNVCFVVRQITTAGTYLASFNNASNASEWFHCIQAIVSGATTGNNSTNKVFSLTAVSATNSSTYDGTIAVGSGVNKTLYVNGSGNPVFIRGVNLSGLETSCAQGYAPWYNNVPSMANIVKAFPGMNAIRLPLNAASFLGLTCLTVNSAGNGWVSTTGASADPYGNYVSYVDSIIADAQANHCYVFIDEHWSAPQFTFNGVTGYAMPLSQGPFTTTAMSRAFWAKIFGRYGTGVTPQPGISNYGIVFELFNEPFLDQFTGESLTAALYGQMLNGGTLSSWKDNGRTSDVAQSWTTVGYQTLCNDARTANANNVLACGGPGYSSSMSGAASYLPKDSLSPPQIVQTWHPYPTGTYPYSDGDVYGQCYPDPNNGTSAFDTYALNVISSGIPVCITEDGGEYGPNATSGEPHIAFMSNLAKTKGFAGYIIWEAWAPVASTDNGTNNALTTSNTPTQGEGAVFLTFLNSFSASATAPGAPTNVAATPGDKQATVTWNAPASNGGSAITKYTVTPSPNGTAVTSTGLSATVTSLTDGTAYTFTVTATNAAGTGVASSPSSPVTPAAVASLLMYNNGAFGPVWGSGSQDLSYSGTFNYNNTTNLYSGTQYNLSISGQYAGLQHATAWPPYYQGGTNGFDVSSATVLVMDIYCPDSGSNFGLGAHYTRGDENVGADIATCTGIGSLRSVPGVTLNVGWNIGVRIPLQWFGYSGNYNSYKWGLQQQESSSNLNNIKYLVGAQSWIYRGNPNLEAGWTDTSTNLTANYKFLPQTLNGGNNGLFAVNNPPTPASNFYGSISGTTLTVNTASSAGPILAGQTLYYNGASGNCHIVSGSGSTWTLDTNLGTIGNEQMFTILDQKNVPAVQVKMTAANAAWKVSYSAGFSLTPYNSFSFGALPTKTGNNWKVQCYNTAGVAIGTAVSANQSAYCVNDSGISTQSYTMFMIPLSALGVVGQTIGSIAIIDTSGNATNTASFSAVGFFAI